MKFAVIVFPGSNCDQDAQYALTEVLGQQVNLVWHKDQDLGGADVVVLPGGFSYGDYLRTGAIAKFSPVMSRVTDFAAAGAVTAGELTEALGSATKPRPLPWEDVLAPVDWGPLTDIPWAGPVLFGQAPFVYLAVLVGIASWFVLSRTRAGLALRAAGESASTADAAGHSVVGLRLCAVGIGGGLAGASGAYLTLTLTPQWAEGITAGRGWIAVALVIFGAWRPGRAAVGALLFGGLLALKTRLQTFGVDFSPILLSMLPYVSTIAVLIAISVRARNRPSPAPDALGTAYRREER